MNRSVYSDWDDFTVGDDYVYCEEDFKTFQYLVDKLEKQTKKGIDALLQKHGFGNLTVDFFDIEETEMDEDGYDIHAVMFFNGKGISTSKLQEITFTLTGDVSLNTEEYEYMGTVQSWMESPPYEVGYIEVICPDRKISSFEIIKGKRASSSFSANAFIKAIDEYLNNFSKSRRASDLARVRKKRAHQISKRRKRSSGCNCRKK
jgi:hypothetical protein